jgi:hypothetical protein
MKRCPSVQGRGEADVDLEAAAGSSPCDHECTMSVGDRLHDGEAEPDTLAGFGRMGSEPLEGSEKTLQFAGRDQGAGVGDDEVGASRLGAGCDVDPAADDVVPDRIRDEVGGQSLEQVRIAGRPGRLEHHDAPESAQAVSSERSGGDRRQVDRLAPLQPALAAGKSKTRLEQALLSPAGAEDVLADLSPDRHIRVRVGKCQFEKGTLDRQRRTQLMRNICRKAIRAHAHRRQGAIVRAHLPPVGRRAHCPCALA